LKANPDFLRQPQEFWAHIRTISQEIGYTDRKTSQLKVPSLTEIKKAFDKLNLKADHVAQLDGTLTPFGKVLMDYFEHRAYALNNIVQSQFMNKDTAKIEFDKLYASLNPKCPLQMNKQKGDKRNHAFLTGMVNMLIESNIGEAPCDYDPRSLTTITHDSMPFRTLARRVDGAFPSVVNPIAIWEIARPQPRDRQVRSADRQNAVRTRDEIDQHRQPRSGNNVNRSSRVKRRIRRR